MNEGAQATASELGVLMDEIGAAAKAAAATLARADTAAKNTALAAAAGRLRRDAAEIMRANAEDMAAAKAAGLRAALLDRLALDDARVEAIAAGLEAIAELDDPVGARIDEWTRPNGLRIGRVRVPLGVIGVIYESRPNVTADAGALCFKSGNAAILRGGSESFHSSRAIFACLAHGLAAAGLPAGALQLVPTRDRAAVGEMLRMDATIDVIVPRGGRSLVARVRAESPRAGARAPRRQLPRLRPRRRRRGDGAAHRRQRQDAPHRRLRGGRDAVDRPRGHGQPPARHRR